MTQRTHHITGPPAHSHRLVLRVCAVLLICLTATGQPIPAQDTTSDNAASQTTEEKIRTFLRESVFQSLGIISGIVVSDEYNTGMGAGANISQTLIEPAVKLKTTLYFWGASKDSSDVSTFGIEESLLLEKSPRPNIDFFSGATAGYYSSEYDVLHSISGGEYSEETNDNRFDIYLSTGFRYRHRTNRSITFQLNYLVTRETTEVHFVAGLEFFKPLR